jgi:transposase-like protein
MGQRSIEMSRRRHTPEQVVRKLREADRLLGEGTELPEVCKTLEVSEATFHRWRAQYGGMKADDVKRLSSSRARTPSSSGSWPIRRSTSRGSRS